MNSGKYVFSQITALVSSTSFQTIVNRHSGDYKVREFSCWKQFLCMAFGQLTHRESINFRLVKNSRGINTGTNDAAQPTDMMGKPRPKVSGRDRGAFEQ